MPFIAFLDQLVNQIMAIMPRPKPPQPLLDEACVIAHRGAHDRSQGIIENTDAAFARALACGCWGIELDVRATADGVLVVHHDPNLLRLWQRPDVISQLPFQTLRALVPAIPTLAEVVDRYGKRMHLFIEIKVSLHGDYLYDHLKALTPMDDYHLISLNETLLTPLKRFPRAALMLVPEHHNVSQFCRISLKKHYGGVLGHYLLLTNKKIKPLVVAGQQVGVGFIDSQNSLYRELNRGIRWVFTNQAQRIRRVLAREK